jgi:hypothetical protein
VGGRLVAGVLDDSGLAGLKVTAWCPFAHGYIERQAANGKWSEAVTMAQAPTGELTPKRTQSAALIALVSRDP